MKDIEILGGLAALILVLIVGTLFGRLHGSTGGEVKACGDRVACGLLALPLISLAVHFVFPSANLAWTLIAPLPLALYVVLLAGTDIGWRISTNYFTTTLVFVGMGIYLFMALAAWLLRT